jgi:putative effector of murein hydrolase
MKPNVGNVEKYFRIGLSVIIFAAGIYFKSWWGLVGLVPLLTGVFNFCPLYALLGISTLKVKETKY